MRAIYHFSPSTGEYIGTTTAEESPLEPGVYLIPAHATELQPLDCGEHEVSCFSDGAWTVRPDWRGVELWSTYNGDAVAIADIGVAPVDVGATEQPRPSIDHVWQDGAWALDEAKQTARLSYQARLQRDAALTVCDWTQLPDAPVDQSAWRAYRQALRDLPSQPGFPSDTAWPAEPAK